MATQKSPAAAPKAKAPERAASFDFDRIKDVEVTFTMRLGQQILPLQQVLEIGNQSLIELDRGPEDPIEVLVNGRVFARGEVVTVGEHFGVRLTEVVGAADGEPPA